MRGEYDLKHVAVPAVTDVAPMMDELNVNSFLKLGYFIRYAKVRQPLDYSRIDKSSYRALPSSQLAKIGVEKLRASIAQDFRRTDEHVVPMSGGMDSRLILAALLEFTDASNIHTYTYGIPGSYDYEIGCLVAKHAGTRHTPFAMNGYTYHEDELLDFADRADCQAVLFYQGPIRELSRRYSSSVIWSGYVGDAVAGSALRTPASTSIIEAKKRYLFHRAFVRSPKLHNCADSEFLPHMAGGAQDPNTLTYDEQVLFDEGVHKFTASHNLLKGFHYKTPLINSPWMDFMFSVPNELRLGEQLLVQLATSAFPKLFSLPTKNTQGWKLGSSSKLISATKWVNKARKLTHRVFPTVGYPLTMYNDFDEGIRNSPDLRRVVRSNLEDLKRRQIVDWIDFDALWKRHDWRTANHGLALIILASLELNLKAMARRQRPAHAQ